MDGGLKVPEQLKQAFEELHTGQVALQFKADAFARTVHGEAHALAVASRATWDEAKAVMALQGDWRYEDGAVYPVVAPSV